MVFTAGQSPEWIIWLIYPGCNLGCRHCYASQYVGEKPLPFDKVIEVIRDAGESGVEHINYTGGEPLLRKDMIGILKETIDQGITASLFTNATLLNESIVSELAKLEILVYSSMDASNKELYEKIRGMDTWEKFVNGVKLIKQHGLYLHINITVSEFNWQGIGETIRKAFDLGADSVSIIPSMPAGRAKEAKVYVKPEHFLVALKQAEESASELGVFIDIWCAPFIIALPWAKHLRYGNCRDWAVMDITPSGKVVLCDVISIVVADVLKHGVRGAWSRLHENPFYAKALTTPNQCLKCSYSRICRGGCYARAYNLYRTFDKPDPLCPLIKMAFDQHNNSVSS